jgi:hypothetical protein
VKYPRPAKRAGALAGGVAALAAGFAAAARRRKENRRPRVRVRVAHGEIRVLEEGSPHRQELLDLAGELVTEYGRVGRGR